MKKALIVIDMQNDFITGALGSEAAAEIVPDVVDLVRNFKGFICFTQDTHYEDYWDTLEGKSLPVEHCQHGTKGWRIIPELEPFAYFCIPKSTYAFPYWHTPYWAEEFHDVEEIVLCGVCTDICVISNALALRAFFPNCKITVDARCCAGLTEAKHLAALEVMKSCNINVINE